jgi:hypothetical protein
MMKQKLLLVFLLSFSLWLQTGRTAAARNDHNTKPAPTTETKTLSPAGYKSISQDMVIAPDGSINIVWVQGSAPLKQAVEHDHSQHSAGAAMPAPTGNDLYFTRSTDGGRTFTTPVRVNNTPGIVRGVNSNTPRLAIGKSGVIHVAYSANRYSNPGGKLQVMDLHYARSTNRGGSFEAARPLNNDTDRTAYGFSAMGNAASHAFASIGIALDGTVHVFWIDSRYIKSHNDGSALYSVSSRDDGKTFTRERELFRDGICGCCQTEAAFLPGGALLLSWRHVYANGARETVVAKSVDGGKTYSAPVRLTQKDWIIEACPHKPAAIAFDKQGRIFATWYTEAEKPGGAYFTVSADGGKTYAAPQPLHPNAKVWDHSQIAIAPDNSLRVVWDAKVGEERKLFTRVSTDHGKTLGSITEIETPAGNAAFPSIAIGASGAIHLAWQQDNQVMFRTLPALVAQK